LLVTVTDIYHCNSVDEAGTTLIELIFEAKNLCVPHKSITIRPRDKSWMTLRLKQGDKIHKKAKLSTSPALWASCRKIRKQLVGEISTAKSYDQNRVIQSLSDTHTASKKWWHIIKHFYRCKTTSTIPPLKTGNTNTTDSGEKATFFNEYFYAQSSIDDTNAVLPELSFVTDTRLFECITSAQEVELYISDIDISKAHGYDNVDNRFLKLIGPLVSDKIAYVFNLSLCHGIFPQSWKCANVVPIFKKGDPQEVSNYRPVSCFQRFPKFLKKLCINTFSTTYYLKTYYFHFSQILSEVTPLFVNSFV